jgi:hypothetical protein
VESGRSRSGVVEEPCGAAWASQRLRTFAGTRRASTSTLTTGIGTAMPAAPPALILCGAENGGSEKCGRARCALTNAERAAVPLEQVAAAAFRCRLLRVNVVHDKHR